MSFKSLIISFILFVSISLFAQIDPFILSYEGNGTEHMNIYLTDVKLYNELPQEGDVIAAFDGELCVGKIIVSLNFLKEGVEVLKASRNEIGTTNTGYTTGNPISIRIWDISENIIYNSNLKFYNSENGVEISPVAYKSGEKAIVSVQSNYELNLFTKFGDADGNGHVQAYDAAIVLQKAVGLDPIPRIDSLPWLRWREVACDVNKDGQLTAYDAALILRKVVGLINDFP